MTEKLAKTFYALFAVLWMVIIFSEYWRYNPNYGNALRFFQYSGLLLGLLLLGGSMSWALQKSKKQSFKYLNGLSIFGGLVLLEAIVMSVVYNKINTVNLSATGLFAHLGHFIGVAFCVFMIYLVARSLGLLLANIFPPKIAKKDLPIIQVALGIMGLTLILFFLGILGLLHIVTVVPLLLIILLFDWKNTWLLLKNLLFKTIKIPKELNALGIFSFLFLAVFVIANFAQVLRPFPMGTDSINLYVNLPSLIHDYHGLVAGNQPYNWSLFMSLGLIVFGRMDVVLALSFFGGILSLIALFRLSQKWLNINYSALTLLLFYSLPMINFLSFMDMKIDMGLLFITLSVLLLFVNWLPNQSQKIAKSTYPINPPILKIKTFFQTRIPAILIRNRLLVLMGLLAGFAFGIKLTALFFFLALLTALWFSIGGMLAFLSAFFLCFSVVFIFQLDAQPLLRQFHESVFILQWILLIIGVGLLTYLFIKEKKKAVSLISASLISGVFFTLPFIPWLGKNLSETGAISVTTLLSGQTATPIFEIEKTKNKPAKNIIIPGLYAMPETSATQPKKLTKVKNSVREDLHRFMGYEPVLPRYLSTPYDVCIKTNIANFFIDIGILLLLFCPIVFLFPKENRKKGRNLAANLATIALCFLLLIFAIPNAFLNNHQLSEPTAGISLLTDAPSSGFLGNLSDWINGVFLQVYTPFHQIITDISGSQDAITYPILIVLFSIILLLIYQRIKNHSNQIQGFILFILMYFFLWWILGVGAAWYGMLIFCVPYIFILKSIQAEKLNDFISQKIKKGVVLFGCGIWVLLAFTHRTTNFSPVNKERAKHFYIPTLLAYQTNNINKNTVMDAHFPKIREITNVINQEENSLIYRVGTLANFFIKKNDRRVLNDTFLDFFADMVDEFETKEQIISELKKRGFKYIVFDLVMSANDVTPDKSLTRKFTQFMNTLYNNPAVELVNTDRTIKLNDTGEVVNAVFQDNGTIVNFGQIALFKIQ